MAELRDTRHVYGIDMAKMVCWRLPDLSCWFEMTPLPDGYWRFTFKDESGLLVEVDRVISDCANEIQA